MPRHRLTGHGSLHVDALAQAQSLLDFDRAPISLGLYPLVRNHQRRIILTGVGASHVAALPSWGRLVAGGRSAWWIDTENLLENPQIVTTDSLLIATSRSGAGGQVRALADRLSETMRPAATVAITDDLASPLAEVADCEVLLRSGASGSPTGFLNALIAHDEDVVIPATATEQIHYEGELAVVIGKKARHLSEHNAMDCVFGYTIGNDVSERSWQKADRGLWRAKNADTFKPMGPWIETSADLDKMETIVRVNGKESNRFRTGEMIFGVREFIVEMTKYFTLWPGDVIWMGTDGASPNIKAGDTVEIEITGIGTLRNRFVAEVKS